MNAQILSQIYRAKDERRKQLRRLPIDEKVVIIERLRDIAIALRAERQKLSQEIRQQHTQR